MDAEREQVSKRLPEQIGRYRVIEQIGSGGMGQVYRAEDAQRQAVVAIKLLAAALATDPNNVRRFEREIEALKRLDHPNIVRLLDSGTHDGIPYFVMEYVEGRPLTALMRRMGRLPWRQAVHWAIQICDGLAHAHARQVIHRDLKPGNVLIAADGVVKLTDFGIARVFGTATLTSAGSVVGTVEYMSPEQASGKRIDARSDLYSLGILLYTMVTGSLPYRGKDYLEVLQQHRYGRFDPPRKLAPEIPVWLDDLICQLMEKEPQRRPPNAETVRRRLIAVLRKVDLRHAEHSPSRERDTFVFESTSGPVAVVEPETGETAVLAQGEDRDPTEPSPTLLVRLMRSLAGTDDRPIERTRKLFARVLLAVVLLAAGYGAYRYLAHSRDAAYQWQRLQARVQRMQEGDLAILIPELREFVERFEGSTEAEQAEAVLFELESQRRQRQLLKSPLVRSLRPTGGPMSPEEEQYVAALLVRWLEGRDAALAALERVLTLAPGSRPTAVQETAAEDYIALTLEKATLLQEQGQVDEARQLVQALSARFRQFPSARVRTYLRRAVKRFEQSSEPRTSTPGSSAR